MKRSKKPVKEYIVTVREVHCQGYRVIALSPKGAKQFVADGGGDLIEDTFEYSHTLDPDTWMVEEVPQETKSLDARMRERCAHCPHLSDSDNGSWTCALTGCACVDVKNCKEWPDGKGEL